MPTALTAGASFRLEPLSPRHNEADYAAWTSSIEHIRATPGFAGRNWPDPAMTLEQNLADLQMHAEHFARRQGFTYTVLDAASGEVIGCVYIYPADRPGRDARVRSWVRADPAAQDTGLAHGGPRLADRGVAVPGRRLRPLGISRTPLPDTARAVPAGPAARR